MKDLCCDLLPDERIRVFISSAQNEENGFQWEPLRRRIKETLKSCPFLSPFIIEDSPHLSCLQRSDSCSKSSAPILLCY